MARQVGVKLAGASNTRILGEHPLALLGRRIRTPIGQGVFWIVLLFGIGVFGYLAVWIEESHVSYFVATKERLTPDLEPLRLAYATAILAVAAPCVAQLVLSMNKMAALAALLIFSAIGALAYWVSSASPDLHAVHLYGIPGLLIAVLSWWLANGEDELFQDRTFPNVPSGGTNTQRPLAGGKSKVKT